MPRRLAGSAYAARQAECARAVAAIAAPRSPASAACATSTSSGSRPRARTLDAIAYRRARHVVTENARVLAAASALDAGDAEALGPILSAGHASLRDDFDVSTPALDRLAELAEATPGVLGARLTGAGFGGCLIALARPGCAPALAAAIAGEDPPEGGARARVLPVRPAAGAGLVQVGG